MAGRLGKVRMHLDEDTLYSDDVRRLVLKRHGLVFVSEDRHWVVNGREVDVVLWARSGAEVRTIGFELKRFKLKEALKQAVERRSFFHYFYIVVMARPHDTVSFYANRKCRGEWPGIGLICYPVGEHPILLATSRFNPHPTSSLHKRAFLTQYVGSPAHREEKPDLFELVKEMVLGGSNG